MDDFATELIRPATLRSQVEDFLRTAISNGQFKPGERLIERDLCERMKISRPSLREALRALEAEKLIVNVPHRGPQVAKITVDEAKDLYAMRALMEGFAAHEFARLASNDLVEELGEAIAGLRVATTSGDKLAMLEEGAKFYDILLNGSENKLMMEILKSLFLRIKILRSTSLNKPERAKASLHELEAVYQAIASRNPVAARDLSHAHVASAEKSALEMLSEPAEAE